MFREWVVSLDSDVVTTARCIRAAIAFLQEHKDYGAVVVTYQGHPPPEESECGQSADSKLSMAPACTGAQD